MEIDAHGGGIDTRGATFPGAGPYVELGRGIDFSWSATSAGNDNIDIFVEELCGDDTHYVFDGECLEMESFDAGRLGFGAGNPVVFNETVHGPVLGYATVDGERVALSSARTTRGPRGPGRVPVRGPERERPDRRGELLRRRVGDRVHVQLVLRGRQGCRDVLERAAAGAPPARGHRTADEGQRPLRVAWLPRRGQAPARDRAGRRHDRELEQQAGRRLGGGGRHTGPTAPCTATTCWSAPSTRPRRTRWRPRSAR